MPRGRSAALAAWVKRKREQDSAPAPGGSTAAAVAAMSGVGSTTRAAILDANARVKAAKQNLAAGRAAAPLLGAKDSKSMPIESGIESAKARMAAKPAGPKPVAGPMAGKGTATRAAIGQKAAAKRRENKAKQEEAAKEIGKDLIAAEKGKGSGDLFGHNRDADATPGGDAFNRAFEKDNDAHFAKYDPANVVKAEKLGGGVNARWKIKYADGTRGNIKPSKGERLDIHRDENDFPPKGKAGLAEREAATHYVDKLLGLNTTAPAKMFNNVNVQGNKLGKAVVLGWQSGDLMERQAHRGKPVDGAAVSRIQILDAVIGGQDRHQQNFVIEVVGGKAVPRPIDHGYAFSHDRDSFGRKGTGAGSPDKGGRRLVARFMKVDKMDEGVRQATVERMKKIDWDKASAYASSKFGLSRSEASALKRRALRTLKALETDSEPIMSGSTLERFTARNASRP